MKKRLLIGLSMFLFLLTVGCGNANNPENDAEATKTVKAETVKHQKPGKVFPHMPNFVQEEDETLLEVARYMTDQFDLLSLAETVEEYDKLRKQVFVSYDFYAPLDEYDGPDKEVKTTATNETLVKGESFFIYEFDFETKRTLKDGTDAPLETGHVTFELIQSDDNTFKITVIR